MGNVCDTCGGCASDPCSIAMHEEHASEVTAEQIARWLERVMPAREMHKKAERDRLLIELRAGAWQVSPNEGGGADG